MDIHPPHPIHSWKDFGVQLITITAGKASAPDVERFQDQVLTVRSILFTEGQLATAAIARSKKALE